MKTRFLISFLFFCCALSAVSQIVDSKRVGEKFVFIDKNGRQVGTQMYDGAWWDGPYGGVRIGDKQTPVDSKGNYIIPLKYTQYDLDDETGNFMVSDLLSDGTWVHGMYSKTGKELIPCIYQELSVYKRGISVRDVNGYFGVYSYTGETIFPVEYNYRIIFDDIDSSEEYEYSFLSKGGTMDPKLEVLPLESYVGMVDDRTMKIIVPCEYAACDDIDKDYIRVNKGGIPSRGTWFENGTWHTDGNWRTAKGGKWGILYKGKEFVPIIYSDVRLAEHSAPIFAVQSTNGKWALWTKGKEITDFRYDFAPEFEDDVAQVSINGSYEMLKNPLKDKNAIKLINDYAKADLKAAPKQNGRATSRYPVATSDIDSNIPSNSTKDNRFAFIIANENYEFAPVPFSLNDGRAFFQYCKSTLGIPETHIFMVEDATLGDIISTIERLKNISDSFDGEAELLFYYAGHGVPDDSSNSAYIVPIDADMKNIHKTGYSLAVLYEELSKLKTNKVCAFIDACFSGAKRENESLLTNRGIAIDTKTEVPEGRMLAFTASTGNETAHQLEKNQHGLFTYYLLKYIQLNKGIPSMGELTDYVTKNVKRQSVVINNKKQTPTVVPSSVLTDSWRNISF